MAPIRGLLFDKDGTLFDFQASWGGWASDLVLDLAGGAPDLADSLAARIRLDRAGRSFHPDSLVIAGTADEAVDALHPGVPGMSRSALLERIIDTSMALDPVEAIPLAPFLERMRAAGYVLGVATNDSEAPARAQLDTLGLSAFFDFIAGADSGYGAKPEPGQCLGFAAATGLEPAQVAMIGDSTHDLFAGSAAGMVPVGVLTGPAPEAALAPHAAVVLPDIGHLPGWLGLT